MFQFSLLHFSSFHHLVFLPRLFFIFLVYSCCHHRLRSSSCYNCRLSCQINVRCWTLFAFNESPSINTNRSQSLVDKCDLHSAKPFHALLSNETIARARSLRKLSCQFGNWIDNDLHCHTIQFIANTNWNRNKWRTQIIISEIRSRWIAMHFQCVLDGMTTTKRKEILWLGIAYFGTCFDFCIERWMGKWQQNATATRYIQCEMKIKWSTSRALTGERGRAVEMSVKPCRQIDSLHSVFSRLRSCFIQFTNINWLHALSACFRWLCIVH